MHLRGVRALGWLELNKLKVVNGFTNDVGLNPYWFVWANADVKVKCVQQSKTLKQQPVLYVFGLLIYIWCWHEHNCLSSFNTDAKHFFLNVAMAAYKQITPLLAVCIQWWLTLMYLHRIFLIRQGKKPRNKDRWLGIYAAKQYFSFVPADNITMQKRDWLYVWTPNEGECLCLFYG